MATPNEKLATSLEVLRVLQDDVGNIIKSSEISRTHRERLQRAGFLKDVMAGWLVVTRLDNRPGDSTYWYASYREFCLRYCNDRFSGNWCLSPEHSLLMLAENAALPNQVVVWSPKASGNNRRLPYDTSIYDLKNELPPREDRSEKDGFPIFNTEAALIKVTERFFKNRSVEAQIVLGSIQSVPGLLVRLLDGGHVKAAGRIAGALRRMGRPDDADEIVKRMRAANYGVREQDPFEPDLHLPQLLTGAPPIVSRIQNVWKGQRKVVLDILPDDRGLPDDPEVYLAEVDGIYVNDAYNSLSIEGYRVTNGLIERVRAGDFDPDGNADDQNSRDALAARGYWQSFQKVRASIARIIGGEAAATVVREDYNEWYAQLFQPSVDAGILRAGVLAGFRNHPVYLRGSRYTPPRVEAVPDGMDALFDLLQSERSAGVRAVLGHWLMGYIHPYSDGNGRMARFLMNAMLASGGHPWTIIRLKDRARYMEALEVASTQYRIKPFAELIAARLQCSYDERT